MRFLTGLAGVLATTGLSITGATVLVGCGKDFAGCEASRTCARTQPLGGQGGKPSENGAGRGGGAGRGAGGIAGIAGDAGSNAPNEAGAGGEGNAGGFADAGSGGHAGALHVDREGGESGSGGEGVTGPEEDHEPPRIVSTLPANGETGVHRDAKITVTFSEPMNDSATQLAYRSTDLPPDQVTLLWSNRNTELVILPKELLGYAAVSDPAADAKHFSFTIAGTASDVAGNTMGDERTFVFTTLRHVEHQLSALDQSWQIIHEGESGEDYSMDKAEKACPYPTAKVYAGDRDDDGSLAFVAGFDLSLLPGGIETWKRVTLRAEMTVAGLNPYGRLGNLLAHRITGADTARLAFNVPIVETLGTFNTFATNAEPSLEVTDAIELDYANRTQTPLSTILFRFEESDDSDNHAAQARASCGSIVLDLDYWAP